MTKTTSKINSGYRALAKIFMEKIRDDKTVVELALFGSVAGLDPHPMNVDMALVLNNFDEISGIAKKARGLTSINANWVIHVFDKKMNFKGFICQRKTCPAASEECYIDGCGEISFLKAYRHYKFEPALFYVSPFEMLIQNESESVILKYKKNLGLSYTRSYDIHETITKNCVDCGETFMIDHGDQKYFRRMEWSMPNRCDNCRLRKNLGFIPEDFDDEHDIC